MTLSYLGKMSMLTCFLLSIGAKAQIYNQDSLVSTFHSKSSYFYLKPQLGLHWSHLTQQGDSRFDRADRFDVRNQRYGLLVGYSMGRFTLETGIATLPVYTGYRFTSDDNFTIGGGTRVIYWQFPLHLEYTFWQPTKHLQLHVLAGVAFNTERGESLLPAKTASTYYRINLRSDTSTISTIRNTRYRKQFGSATLGLGFTYQLLRQFELNLQINRLLSSASVLQQDIQLYQNNDPILFQTTTQAGASGFSVLFGLIYQFNRTKSYKPAYQMPY